MLTCGCDWHISVAKVPIMMLYCLWDVISLLIMHFCFGILNVKVSTQFICNLTAYHAIEKNIYRIVKGLGKNGKSTDNCAH